MRFIQICFMKYAIDFILYSKSFVFPFPSFMSYPHQKNERKVLKSKLHAQYKLRLYPEKLQRKTTDRIYSQPHYSHGTRRDESQRLMGRHHFMQRWQMGCLCSVPQGLRILWPRVRSRSRVLMGVGEIKHSIFFLSFLIKKQI